MPPTSAADIGLADAPVRLDALLSVSRLVAETEDLGATLCQIAREAAGVVAGCGATIFVLGRNGRLRVGGTWGVSPTYLRHLQRRLSGLQSGVGPTGMALTRGQQFVIPDMQAHEDITPEWRERSAAAGYRSLTSTPLDVEGDVVGALNVYRPVPGEWPDHDLEVLSFFSDHAATAIRIADLIDHQNRQVAGLARLVRDLREQTHEYANRLHSIGGLLALGQTEDAARFVDDLLELHGRSTDEVVAGIEHQALAGLLLAEIVIARQRRIDFTVDRRSALGELPAGLGEDELVAIVGHLLEHAFEAIADLPPARRRVKLEAWSDAREAVLKVRDWGERMPSPASALIVDGVPFDARASEHRLPSLTQSLLFEMVSGVGGTLQFVPERPGTTTVIEIPARPGERSAEAGDPTGAPTARL